MIESVLMKYHHGNSVCISSQVGCLHGLPVLCVHSGRTHKKLTSFGDAGSDLPDPEIHGERVSNVVVMGSGEPMDNYDNLIRFTGFFPMKTV